MKFSFVFLLLTAGTAYNVYAGVSAPAASFSENRLQSLFKRQQQLEQESACLVVVDYEYRARALVSDYASFVKDNPHSLEGLLLAGKFYRQLGLDQEAILYFEQANRLSPGTGVACQQLGNYYAELGKPAEALSYFIAAADNNPEVAVYAYQLAELLVTYREFFITQNIYTPATFDKSIAHYFKKSMEIAPEDRRYALRYAESFFDQINPNWAEAKPSWEAIFDQAPTTAEKEYAALRLAQIYYEMGVFSEAKKYLGYVQSTPFNEAKFNLLKQIDKNSPKSK